VDFRIEISQILESIDHDIFDCSTYIKPEIEINDIDTSFFYSYYEVDFIRNRYEKSSNVESGRISISVNRDEPILRVIVTCDHPKAIKLSNEVSTFMFEFRRDDKQWVLVREEDMN